MTTKAETTKREVIRKAYGEHYDEVKNFLDEYGYCDARSKDGSTLGYNAHNVEWKNWNASYKWRPISLSGLETNNGWFSIKEHGLKEGEFEFLIHEGYRKHYSLEPKLETARIIINKSLIENKDMAWNIYSHYRPIEQVKPPLY